jgi:hypothetical protein
MKVGNDYLLYCNRQQFMCISPHNYRENVTLNNDEVILAVADGLAFTNPLSRALLTVATILSCICKASSFGHCLIASVEG